MHPKINPSPFSYCRSHITALEMHGLHRRGHRYCMRNNKKKNLKLIQKSPKIQNASSRSLAAAAAWVMIVRVSALRLNQQGATSRENKLADSSPFKQTLSPSESKLWLIRLL